MKRCSTFYDSWNGMDLLIGLVLSPLWSILCLYLLLSRNFSLENIYLLINLLGGILIGLLSLANYAAKTALYSVDERGISLLLLNRFKFFHPWEEASSIVVCDLIDRQANASHFPVVIRIAARPEKHGPLSREKAYSIMKSSEKWHLCSYWQNHPRTIICIDYSEESLHQIAALSSREIPQKWSSRERREAAYKLYQSLNQEVKP